MKHGQRENQLLTTSDAARVLNVSPDTIRFWERAGKLPAQRTVGGVRLFHAADVAAFGRVRAERRQDAVA